MATQRVPKFGDTAWEVNWLVQTVNGLRCEMKLFWKRNKAEKFAAAIRTRMDAFDPLVVPVEYVDLFGAGEWQVCEVPMNE